MTNFPSRLLESARFALLMPKLLLLWAANAAVGGQAVMEGVMMRGPNHWAIALRRSNGEIVEVHRTHRSLGRRYRWARLPIARGVIALGESLVIGFKALSVSAHYATEWIVEEEQEGDEPHEGEAVPIAERDARTGRVIPLDLHRDGTGPQSENGTAQSAASAMQSPTASTPETEEASSEANPDSLKGWQIAIAMVLALGFSVLLFKLTPALIASTAVSTKSGWFVFAEASIKITIFCAYLALVGLMADMKRVFQYHSAEHKAINAWEDGVELTPQLVNQQSRIHVRCGTAFMLWVFVVAIAVFGVFGYYVQPTLLEVIGSRVVLLPLIAGISFELIKFAGRHPHNPVLRVALAPGLWLQYLTTRECTDDQCEVAIRSLNLVLEREFPAATAAQALDELEGDEAVQVMA